MLVFGYKLRVWTVFALKEDKIQAVSSCGDSRFGCRSCGKDGGRKHTVQVGPRTSGIQGGGIEILRWVRTIFQDVKTCFKFPGFFVASLASRHTQGDIVH